MRAMYLGDILIGFLMLGNNSLKYKVIKHFKPYLYIWRFMIADEYQRKGYGKKAMQRIIEYIKSKYNLKEMIAYTLLENKNVLEYYKKLVFKPIGRK